VTMTLYGFGLEPGSEWSYRGSYSSGGFGFGVAGIGFTPADGTVSGPSVSAGCGDNLSVSAQAIASGGATISTGTVRSPCG
jgi:hypothetical protein